MFVKSGWNDQGMKRIFLSANDHQRSSLVEKSWSEDLFPYLPSVGSDVKSKSHPQKSRTLV